MDQFSTIEKQELLDVLNYQIRSCEKCGLHATRKHALVGEGDINANIMFIALSPGAKEDIQNKMFVGPSGKVFNKLLHAAGIKRDQIFMTNLVKCILPKNRKPKASEIESCSQFLNDEISIIRPKVIVPLGYYATRSILLKFGANPNDVAMNFKNINGRLLNLNGVRVYPLTHPSALLYNPSFETITIEKYKKLKDFV
jgi:uracil-DNA glycosylase family 4